MSTYRNLGARVLGFLGKVKPAVKPLVVHWGGVDPNSDYHHLHGRNPLGPKQRPHPCGFNAGASRQASHSLVSGKRAFRYAGISGCPRRTGGSSECAKHSVLHADTPKLRPKVTVAQLQSNNLPTSGDLEVGDQAVSRTSWSGSVSYWASKRGPYCPSIWYRRQKGFISATKVVPE